MFCFLLYQQHYSRAQEVEFFFFFFCKATYYPFCSTYVLYINVTYLYTDLTYLYIDLTLTFFLTQLINHKK